MLTKIISTQKSQRVKFGDKLDAFIITIYLLFSVFWVLYGFVKSAKSLLKRKPPEMPHWTDFK